MNVLSPCASVGPSWPLSTPIFIFSPVSSLMVWVMSYSSPSVPLMAGMARCSPRYLKTMPAVALDHLHGVVFDLLVRDALHAVGLGHLAPLVAVGVDELAP